MYKPEEVGERLRNLRKNNGFSREQVSVSIGRSPKYYADIERGICGMSLETLMGLADFYHVSLDYLVDGGKHASEDGQTEWAVKKMYQLSRRQKRFVVEVLELLEEQRSGKIMDREAAGEGQSI